MQNIADLVQPSQQSSLSQRREQFFSTVRNAKQLLDKLHSTTASAGSHDPLNNFIGQVHAKITIFYVMSNNPDAFTTEMITEEQLIAIVEPLNNMYQEVLAPMLTRLHNFAKEKDDLQAIIRIANLGSEVIACTKQIYQFGHKLEPNERLYAALGACVMLAGIGGFITTVATPTHASSLQDCLAIMDLGSILGRFAAQAHGAEPEVASIEKSLTAQNVILSQMQSDAATVKSEEPSPVAHKSTEHKAAVHKVVTHKPAVQKPSVEEQESSADKPKKTPAKKVAKETKATTHEHAHPLADLPQLVVESEVKYEEKPKAKRVAKAKAEPTSPSMWGKFKKLFKTEE